MDTFNFETEIEVSQLYDGEKIDFDADSSPKAWEHYQKVYTEADIVKNYSISKPTMFTYYMDLPGKTGLMKDGKWYNYLAIEKSNSNQLSAVESSERFEVKDDIKYYKACLRLRGETDFNFNDKHSPYLKWLLSAEKQSLDKLNECQKMHQSLLNFSLMQSMGNIQGFKGMYCFDRLDRFVFFLYKYYIMSKESRALSPLIKSAGNNGVFLKQFLDQFESVFHYCKVIYFIDNAEFVTELIVNGEKPINNANDVKRYMEIAMNYWEIKKKIFEKIYSNNK